MEARLWWAVATGMAVVLCFLPLTSLLGYESAAVMGVVLGLITIRCSLLDLRDRSASIPLDGFLAWWLGRLSNRLALTLPPATVLLLNATRVQNCDLVGGLLFWLLIPGVSILFSHSLVSVLHRATRSTRVTVGLATVWVAGDTLWFIYRLVVEPPITGVHTLFGYFAGSIYDEALSIPEPLLWYRTLVASASLGAVLLQDAYLRRRTGTHAPGVTWAALVCVTLAIGVGYRAEDLGFWLEREDISHRLGATVETEHFVIHYDPSALTSEQVATMADDHEFRFAELEAFFDVDPTVTAGGRLHSFIYPDRKTQQELFGSRNTFVARPWTYEMHVRWTKSGDTAIAHELAHLFTAPFGGGPLSLATDGGLLVHLGLVEGIALAADWPPKELTPHEAASAMRALDIAPDLRSLFEPTGFWSQPSGKAYTLMGSFVRWLVDSRGIEKFKQVYALGDWEAVYGAGPEGLIGEWEAFVDDHEVDDARLEMARFKYSRQSIFGKVCARTLAELRRQSQNAESRGDYGRALELQAEVLRFQPGASDPGLEMAKLLVKLNRWDDATAIVDELLARSGKKALRPKARARVEELRADILWQSNRTSAAAEGYQRCLGLGQTDSEQRVLHLKLLGSTTSDVDAAEFAFRYLFESSGRSRMLWSARRWLDHSPTDPLARYLMGLQLYAIGLPEEAIPHLEGPTDSLAQVELDEQRQVLWARALAKVQRFDEAQAVWTRLLGAHSSRVRLHAVEGLDRIKFAQGVALSPAPTAP